MCVHALIIEESAEVHIRLLEKILEGEELPRSKYVNYISMAKQLGISKEDVRYNIRKLLRLGYLRVEGNGFIPTAKILFVKKQ